MKFKLTLVVALFALLGALEADELKESRFIDENALRAILELTRQAKPTNQAQFGVKQQYPYLSQKEKLTLQGERQTHYPLQPLNVEYTLLPQSLLAQSRPPITQAKDKLVDVKPIFLPYPLKQNPTLTSTHAAYQALANLQAIAEQPKPSHAQLSSNQPTSQTKPLHAVFAAYPTFDHKQTIAVDNKQPNYQSAYPQHFASFSNQAASALTQQQTRPDPYQRYTATNSPSFIIINPTNYPSYHYYSASNYTFPRGVAFAEEPFESVDTIEEVPDYIGDFRLETAPSAVSYASTDGSPIEVAPILTSLPHTLTGDDHLLAQALLEQSRQPEKSNNLLELLKRDQLKRRRQEQVAAFFFRNLNLNKK